MNKQTTYNKEWYKKYYINNKNKIQNYSKVYRKQRVIEWKRWLIKEYGNPISCEICETKLYFIHDDKKLVPHFDHKRGEFEEIKYSPSSMFNLKINKERQKIFKSCNFGILCDNCNKGLPTDSKKS